MKKSSQLWFASLAIAVGVMFEASVYFTKGDYVNAVSFLAMLGISYYFFMKYKIQFKLEQLDNSR